MHIMIIKAQGDVFKLLVLSDQQWKTPKNKFTVKYDKEKQQIFTFEKLESEKKRFGWKVTQLLK